jgi:hypothetical protein
MTAETVRDAANVRPDHAHNIDIAVNNRSAVLFLIMTMSLVTGWADDHINKARLRHNPH